MMRSRYLILALLFTAGCGSGGFGVACGAGSAPKTDSSAAPRKPGFAMIPKALDLRTRSPRNGMFAVRFEATNGLEVHPSLNNY